MKIQLFFFLSSFLQMHITSMRLKLIFIQQPLWRIFSNPTIIPLLLSALLFHLKLYHQIYLTHQSTCISWWRHQIETFSALLAICAGNSLVTDGFSAQRPVTRSFDVFFDLRLNKRLSNNRGAGDLKHHRAHYDVTVMQAFGWFLLKHIKPLAQFSINNSLNFWLISP